MDSDDDDDVVDAIQMNHCILEQKRTTTSHHIQPVSRLMYGECNVMILIMIKKKKISFVTIPPPSSSPYQWMIDISITKSMLLKD
mmetsp:Transcript_44603/g.50005  ORF Transcript_44603/g.50005 Transcript_44603/m.50005 type:complete len:85 (+) Transcript_44603:56-310(+)